MLDTLNKEIGTEELIFLNEGSVLFEIFCYHRRNSVSEGFSIDKPQK